MSLLDLTRNCFQSGLSARKWADLCKLALAKKSVLIGVDLDNTESLLSNSVLVLFRAYPGDPALQEYLGYALHDGLFSNNVFVSTFLQAARSPELQDAATLYLLCRTALDTHYSSATSSFCPTVLSQDSSHVSSTVQDALCLLRIAHSSAISPSRRLSTVASEFLVVLLSCITDMSQISPAQAMILFQDASDVLQTIQLSTEIRQVLETFALSLSFLIGDDKFAREAQMMQSMQITLGKVDFSEPNSDTDIVTCSLVLNHLVSFRASEFGSGNNANAVALLVGTWRWSSWTPAVFLRQLVLSAFTCLSQQMLSTAKSSGILWRAFVIGRLPRLLFLFQKLVKSDSITEADMQTALQKATEQTAIWAQGDQVLSQPIGPDEVQEGLDISRSILREFSQQLLSEGLIAQNLADILDPLSVGRKSQLLSDAQEAGHDLAAYFDLKLMPESIIEDARSWIDRVLSDPFSHAVFADVVLQRVESLTRALDVESLGHLCKILYTYEEALDIIALHIKMSDVIFHTLTFLEDYDCETVGDPQTAVIHLGDVVLFTQSALIKFNLGRSSFTVGDRTTVTDLIVTPAFVHPVETLAGEDAAAFDSWFKALFDSSSEGIDDNILRKVVSQCFQVSTYQDICKCRLTRPKTLLRICATLFSQAISACAEHRIDVDVLNNGVSYFLGPLLNWTLVGVVKALLQEIQLKSILAPAHLEILQTLLLSPSCPQPVLCLCSSSILRLLREYKSRKLGGNVKFDFAAIQNLALQFVRHPGGLGTRLGVPYQPRQLIQNALAAARTGKTTSLPIATCLIFLPTTSFLKVLWSELSVAASLGEVEACRRLGTFALTTPSTSGSPPLLPVFLHLVVPALIANFDAEQPLSPEQIMNLDLLVTLISSSLVCALHLEYAVRSQNQNQSCTSNLTLSMARRLLAHLRSHKHAGTGGHRTASAIAQRLSATPAFVTNFPIFKGDS